MSTEKTKSSSTEYLQVGFKKTDKKPLVAFSITKEMLNGIEQERSIFNEKNKTTLSFRDFCRAIFRDGMTVCRRRRGEDE